MCAGAAVLGYSRGMATHSEIRTDEAPAPVGPYSQAIRAGEFLFVSGQIPLDPQTGEIVTGEIEVEVRQVLANPSSGAPSRCSPRPIPLEVGPS